MSAPVQCTNTRKKSEYEEMEIGHIRPSAEEKRFQILDSGLYVYYGEKRHFHAEFTSHPQRTYASRWAQPSVI